MRPEALFELIKYLSPKELYYHSMNETIDYFIIDETRLHSCINTSYGLLTMLRHPKDLVAPSEKIEIKNLAGHVSSVSQRFLNKEIPPNTLYSYRISLGNNTLLYHLDTHEEVHLDHTFIVFQYKLDKEMRYRFFQSYINKYSLQTFIIQSEREQNSHDLNQSEFNQFIVSLTALSEAIRWTKPSQTFYHQYFKVNLDLVGAVICEDMDTDLNKVVQRKIKFDITGAFHTLHATAEERLAMRREEVRTLDKKFIYFRRYTETDSVVEKAIESIKFYQPTRYSRSSFYIHLEDDLNDLFNIRVDGVCRPVVEALYQLKNVDTDLARHEARQQLLSALYRLDAGLNDPRPVLTYMYPPNRDAGRAKVAHDAMPKNKLSALKG